MRSGADVLRGHQEEDHTTFSNIAPVGKVGFVVLEMPNGPLPGAAIEDVSGDYPTVFVTYSGDAAQGEAARAAGAVVVKMRGENETPPARSRNAGFRQLRKVAPDIDYVQFLNGDHCIAPDWLEAATGLLDKRPEVAAVEGEVVKATSLTKPSKRGVLSDNYETIATGENVLIRVKSFVDIGGLRGDLVVADVQDFCLRTRGRGRHIWHINMPMALSSSRKIGFGGWWKHAHGQGFEHAYAAALHGIPPERYRVTEMRRAVLWGGAFPFILLVVAASVTALFYYAVTFTAPIFAGIAVLAAGLLVYLVKAIIQSSQNTSGRKPGLLNSIQATVAHIPEFFGVLKFMSWRRKQASHD